MLKHWPVLRTGLQVAGLQGQKAVKVPEPALPHIYPRPRTLSATPSRASPYKTIASRPGSQTEVAKSSLTDLQDTRFATPNTREQAESPTKARNRTPASSRALLRAPPQPGTPAFQLAPCTLRGRGPEAGSYPRRANVTSPSQITCSYEERHCDET